MYYYGFRFHDANLQRWLNRDPIDEVGGLNLYCFVDNGPTIWIDPYGLYTLGECLQICAAFCTGAGQGLAAEADGALPFVDPFAKLGAYDPNNPTMKKSEACGAIAACAAGGAGALRAAGISSKIALHGPHHSFGPLGRLPHLQVSWWRPGVPGSGGACRLPLPPSFPGTK